MSRRYIHIFCGVGMGKTSAALGKGFREASGGKSVVVIRFLKKKHTCEREEFFKQLEPQIRLFRFEKFPQNYESLTEQEKEEENLNIKNGLNFARKVIQTEECDVLKKLIDQLGSGMELYLTGTSRCEELWPYVDEVTEMTTPYRRTPDSHFCEED